MKIQTNTFCLSILKIPIKFEVLKQLRKIFIKFFTHVKCFI